MSLDLIEFYRIKVLFVDKICNKWERLKIAQKTVVSLISFFIKKHLVYSLFYFEVFSNSLISKTFASVSEHGITSP